jgi:DNA-binding response OmpR family regulator
MQGDRERILNAGFDGYLSKPVNSRSLDQELDRLLKKREDQRRGAAPSDNGKARAASNRT